MRSDQLNPVLTKFCVQFVGVVSIVPDQVLRSLAYFGDNGVGLRCRAAVMDNHVRAFLRKSLSGRAADTSRSSRDERRFVGKIVLRKNSIRPDTLQYPLAQLRKFSAKGRYRSESVRDRWSPTSDTGERGTDRTLPLLRRVREFPYIGMELGVRQARQSVTG